MATTEEIFRLQDSEAAEQNRKAGQLVLAIASQKRWMLLGGLFLALPICVFELLAPPRYTAQSVIMPPQLSRGSAAAALMQAGSGDLSGLLGGASQVGYRLQTDLFVTMLAVRPIQEAIVKRYDLQKVYHAATPEMARMTLAKATGIVGTKDGLIIITVTDGDRERSTHLANAYPEALQSFMTGLALTEASNRRAFYERQLARTKGELSLAELHFKQMQQSSHMIALDSQASTLLSAAAGLSAQVRAKEVELEQLRSYSTDANPQVQILRTQIAALRGQLAQVESHSTANGYSGSGLSSVPGAEIEFIRATRELKYQEGLYDVMVKQYEGSILDEAKEAPSAQLIEPAVLPERPSGPHRARTTFFAFIAGAFLGLLVVVIRYWLHSLSEEGRTRVRRVRSALLSW